MTTTSRGGAGQQVEPGADAPIISVRDLKVEYKTTLGTVNALNGVSFDVPRGKVLGIVGESGSGKSVTARTILRILERQARITEGSVIFHRSPDDHGLHPVIELDDHIDQPITPRAGSTSPDSTRVVRRCGRSAVVRSP